MALKGYRNWFFTWNNYPQNYNEVLLSYDPVAYVWQPEKGENGTPHIQGYMEFANCRKFEALHNRNQTIHWEKCKKKEAATKYCSKSKTRDGPMTTKGLGIVDFTLTELREWQGEIIKIIEQPTDDTKINWIYDEKGGKGKTALTKHICSNYNAMMVGGNANDIKYGVAQWIKEKKELDILIINVPRSVENHISYNAIECIKDGIFYSGKYESEMVMFKPPHILIFANCLPDISKISERKKNLINLDENENINVEEDSGASRARPSLLDS